MSHMTTNDLSALTSSQLLEKLDELKDRAYVLGYEMVEAETLYKNEKELLPILLAERQSKFMESCGVSVSVAKVQALAHEDYKKSVCRMNAFGHDYRLKESEYKAIIKSLDVLTAISYVRNNELKLAR